VGLAALIDRGGKPDEARFVRRIAADAGALPLSELTDAVAAIGELTPCRLRSVANSMIEHMGGVARRSTRDRRLRRAGSRFLRLAAATALAGVLLPGPASAETAYVSISGNAFTPSSVRVQMGPPELSFPQAHAHVQFVMVDQGTQHNVTFDDPSIPPSPNLSASEIHDAVFTAPGTFAYGCTIHPSMRGTVVVTEMRVATTTTATTTTPPPPPPTVPSTAAPTTAPPASSAVTPRPTAARAASPTAATTGPTTTTTVAPASTTLVQATSTSVPEATTTTEPPGPADDREVGVAAAARAEPSSGPRWPLVALVVGLAGAAAIFGAHRIRSRPTPPDS
jgi:plastocyanin